MKYIEKNNIQLVIPMSGRGTRFIDSGYSRPKPLIEIDGKPMVQYVLELFPGVTDVIFICNNEHLKNTNMMQILNTICPQGKIFGINPHKKGPVYTTLMAANYISDTKEIIVSYCDYGTEWNFEEFLSTVRIDNYDGAIAVYKGFHPHMLGSDNYAFCREKDNILLEIKEKESFTKDKMSEYASNGTYYFKTGSILKKYFSELIDFDINLNGEYYVSLVYNLLVRDGLKTVLFETNKMLQFGTPYDLEIYQGWSNYFSNPFAPTIDINATLILPMSGKGARFSKQGYTEPKPLLPINGQPMFVRAVNCLPKTNDAVFICHEEQEEIVKSYYPNSKICSIDYIPPGQACTCHLGIDEFGIEKELPILISACDNGVSYNEQKFLDLVNDKENDIIVWSFTNAQTSRVNPDMYSWLEINENNFVKSVSCKKFISGRKHAIIGTMYFRKAKYFLEGLDKNFRENKKINGEFTVDDVLNQCIISGLKVKVFEVDHYICWGTPNDYKTYNYWNEHFNPKH